MVDRSFDEYAFRLARYGYWGAAQCWRDGTRCRALSTCCCGRCGGSSAPTSSSSGSLDGSRGLVFCMLQAYGTYMKFAILWGWQVNHARGIEPKLPGVRR